MWSQRNTDFLGGIRHECGRNLTDMWMERLLASGNVTHTVLVLGITETEENFMLLEGSGVNWADHRPARFSLYQISPGHHTAFKGAARM